MKVRFNFETSQELGSGLPVTKYNAGGASMELCLTEQGNLGPWGTDAEGRTQAWADAEGQNVRVGDPLTGDADRRIEESADKWVDGGQMNRRMDRPMNR